MILENGAVLDGKFEIVGCIASGGMGEVYRGVDLDLSRSVAIKVLTKSTDEFTERFIREAKSMAALDHPNIVPIYGIGTHQGFHYFVMKFVVGQTLEHVLKRQRLELEPCFEMTQITDIICAMFRALDHAHRRGLLHRDIKPGNIILDANDQPILMDFGIVKRLEDSRTTQTGVIFGTPQYMSPEQAMGQGQTPATDVYSVGVIAFEMLTGRLPFVADSVYSMLLAHVNRPVPDLRELNPLVPKWLADVVHNMLKKNPDERFSSANEVVKAIEVGQKSESRHAIRSDTPHRMAHMPIIIEKKTVNQKRGQGQYSHVVTKQEPQPKHVSFGWAISIFVIATALGLYFLF